MGIGGSKAAVIADRVNFEAVPTASADGLLLTTLGSSPGADPECAIAGTVPECQEAGRIKDVLSSSPDIPIVIYGSNSVDVAPFEKWRNLTQRGFTNVTVYTGGLFEWLLLREVYGAEVFPVTNPQNDLLRFKGTGKSGRA